MRQGMHSDQTDFVDSVLLQMHASVRDWAHNNTLEWRCGGYTLNVCERIIFEDNRIRSTEAGVEPHGNSIWFGDW